MRNALDELDRVAPGRPLLALGQTIFWDEPMKAGVALAVRRLGSDRRLVAGVHDTDYFAKLPHGQRQPGRFRAFPHNDGSTRGLWSAAGEFSALFGSETVITRELLQTAGLRLSRLQSARTNFVDEATEAWGWRGIVSLDDHAPVTADLPLRNIFNELKGTLIWALDESLQSIAGSGREKASELADELRATVCDAGEDRGQSLSAFYRRLLPALYEFAAGVPVDIDTTATTELLRFNTATCDQPRFEMFDLFVNQATRAVACGAYNEAIRKAAGLYELSRFGTGAVPFDIYIPGIGRGTLRIGTRGAVIMTPKPQFLSFRRPLTGVRELAELIEAKFGPNCTVVGKAVSLIGMLAREHVFVFHEGASGYVKHSRTFHTLLGERLGWNAPLCPILRVRYNTWDALKMCCSWLRLPDPLQRPFGTEELCAPSFAQRWRQVGEEQGSLLEKLGRLRRPTELIAFLDSTLGGFWRGLAEEYRTLQTRLEILQRDLEEVHRKRQALYARIRELKSARIEAEAAKGRHWRAHVWEKEAGADALAERERLTGEVERLIHERTNAENEMRHLRKEQNALLQDEEVRRVHERRQAIEMEAELKRLRLIRGAVIASRGLAHANHRPSAWWFRLVCPDGLWFRETVDTAEYYLEPLR